MSLSPSLCEKAAKLMTVLMAHWNAYRQAPLPGPREKLEIDWSLGDAELFESYFFPCWIYLYRLYRISWRFVGGCDLAQKSLKRNKTNLVEFTFTSIRDPVIFFHAPGGIASCPEILGGMQTFESSWTMGPLLSEWFVVLAYLHASAKALVFVHHHSIYIYVLLLRLEF